MSNPNPVQARQAKLRYRSAGGLPALQAMLWQALLEAESVLLHAGEKEVDLKLKAVHAISQAGGQYARLLELGEHEARLKAVEAFMEEQQRAWKASLACN